MEEHIYQMGRPYCVYPLTRWRTCGCFHFLAVARSVVVNISGFCVAVCFHFSRVDWYLEVEMLGQGNKCFYVLNVRKRGMLLITSSWISTEITFATIAEKTNCSFFVCWFWINTHQIWLPTLGLTFAWLKLHLPGNITVHNFGKVWGYHKSKKFQLLNLCFLMQYD